jgi:hypothetical protein
MVREHGGIAKWLRFKGYLEREPGFPILSRRCKATIREVFDIVDTAYEVEVAGIQASGHLLGLHPVNGCYGVASGRLARSGTTSSGASACGVSARLSKGESAGKCERCS